MNRILRLAIVVGVLWMSNGTAIAQESQGAIAVPIRVVNGHLVVLTDIVGFDYTDTASFEISFEYPDSLTLHPDQFKWVGMDPIDPGRGPKDLVHLLIEPGIKLSIPAGEIAREPSTERVALQNSMTKLYSTLLGERKLKGTIGVKFLAKYHVTLDIPGQQLLLAPPRAPGDPAPTAAVADILVSPFEYANDQIRVPLSYTAPTGDSRSAEMVIGGTAYDTFIDASLASSLGRPAGNVGPAWLADSRSDKKLDLSRYVAFRPKTFADAIAAAPAGARSAGAPGAGAPASTPVLLTGVNMLEHFRVELDWTNRTLAFTQKKVPHFPQADFDFFLSSAQGTSDGMLAYLEKHPSSRLSREAAELLMQWRLEKEKAGDAAILTALKWIVRTSLPGRLAESCAAYVEKFRELPDRTDLTIAAAKEGLEHSREAFDPRVVPLLHHALGEAYVKKGDQTAAWKHFLSAAFMSRDNLGMDLSISLNLARIYDQQGRVRRAYSRYKRVAEAPSMGAEIDAEVTAAMARLRPQLPHDDVLLADESKAGNDKK